MGLVAISKSIRLLFSELQKKKKIKMCFIHIPYFYVDMLYYITTIYHRKNIKSMEKKIVKYLKIY